jgi:hypothetical protein
VTGKGDDVADPNEPDQELPPYEEETPTGPVVAQDPLLSPGGTAVPPGAGELRASAWLPPPGAAAPPGASSLAPGDGFPRGRGAGRPAGASWLTADDTAPGDAAPPAGRASGEPAGPEQGPPETGGRRRWWRRAKAGG